MTREEAKKFLIDISYSLGNISIEELSEKDGEKMREAIQALEQEPCEDAISRQQSRSEYADWYGYGYQDNWFYKRLGSMPSVAIPSAQPKTGH